MADFKFLSAVVLACIVGVLGQNTNEEEAKLFLSQYDDAYGVIVTDYVQKSWNYDTNITNQNGEAVYNASLKLSQFSDEAYVNASSFDPTNFSDDTKRQLKFVGSAGFPNEADTANLTTVLQELATIYARGTVCFPDEKEECVPLDPNLTEMFATSRDEAKLRFAWGEWRKNVGRTMKPLYLQYAELKNSLAQIRGYNDYGAELRDRFETDTFEQDMLDLYDQLRLVYEELHCYVRRKLYEEYGSEVIDLTGPIPGHLLGDIWGRFWTNIYDLTVPFPDGQEIDPTQKMLELGYTPRKMFDLGNEFYQSMGLMSVPSTFFNLSMIEKPDDGRDVVCHATAWDFYDGKDFRIKMCTLVNFDDFLTIHHELGHIQYFMQYADLPRVYRDGANDGFHEAIGELMSMSVATPKHLYGLGLLDELVEDYETDINFLLKQSYGALSTLPFHLVMDVWRWRAFRGDYASVDDWNDEYWKLKKEFVGVVPPVERTGDDMDPPTIFHVSGDYDMIRYFTRTVLQYQFQEQLCKASGHVGPLYKCDFGNSTAAGDKLKELLTVGSSKPWPDVLEAFTGSRKMDVQPLLNYYLPLTEFLIQKNLENGDVIGWGKHNYRKPGTSHRFLKKNQVPFRRS